MENLLFNISRIVITTIQRWCSTQKIPKILCFKFKDSEFNLPSVKMSEENVRMFFSDEEYEEKLYSDQELNEMDLFEDGCLNNGSKKYSIRLYPHEMGYTFIYYMIEFGDKWKCYRYSGLADLISLKEKHSEWLETLECAESFD